MFKTIKRKVNKMITQKNRTKETLTREMVTKGNGELKKKLQTKILVPKGAPSHLLEKYKKCIVKRDEYLEYSVRGSKGQALAEISQLVKWLSVTDTKGAFEMLARDYKIAYGGINQDLKTAGIFVKSYLKKFGIKDPKIAQTKQFVNGDTIDVIKIWSPTPISPDA